MDRASRNLIVASALYLASTAVGTALSIAYDLPARAAGILNGYDVPVDFVTLTGTALSPPLFMLVAQVVFTVFLFRHGQVGRAGVGRLTVLGILYTAGQLVEPIVYTMFNPATFDPLVALVVLCNLAFGAAMAVLGAIAWRSTRLAGTQAPGHHMDAR